MKHKQRNQLLYLVLCAWMLMGLGGCKKKTPIDPFCVKVHNHVVSLIQRELQALPKDKSATPAQQKQAKRLAKLHKNLTSKRGKERSILICSKSNKYKAKVKVNGKSVTQVKSPSPRHQCALQATSTQQVRNCYLPPRKKKK